LINTKSILLLFVIMFFTSCSNKQIINIQEKKEPSTIKITRKDFTNNNQTTVIKNNTFKTTYISNNIVQKEFLNILKYDTYASLCSSKKLYNQVKLETNVIKRDKLLEKLLLNYTYNLANGCIDIKSMQKKLAYNRRHKIKTAYDTYNTYVNKQKILDQYRSKEVSIKTILKPYMPKHPLFKKMVKILHSKKLSAKSKYKLRLNIERFKMMRHYSSNNFIQLNVPSFTFDLYEYGRKSMHFNTVVGDYEHQTPILSSKLSYFILNPTWNIPDSIAKNTIIPRMLKDKNYLRKKHIEIHKNYHLTSKRFKQSDINWKKYLKKNVRYIPYKFIQLPSNTNGMGRVKFMFHNKYAVYMHDTIGTWRFKINKPSIRAVSHGCVRLQHPLALIKHVSTYYTKRSYKSVRKIYDSRRMKTISLSKKLPIHISYITAYISKNGSLHFYNDIYGYDRIQKLNFKM